MAAATARMPKGVQHRNGCDRGVLARYDQIRKGDAVVALRLSRLVASGLAYGVHGGGVVGLLPVLNARNQDVSVVV
jgi:hypothetical protein